jgi:hypothetical protein
MSIQMSPLSYARGRERGFSLFYPLFIVIFPTPYVRPYDIGDKRDTRGQS